MTRALMGFALLLFVYRTAGGLAAVMLAGGLLVAVLMFETLRAQAALDAERRDRGVAYTRWEEWTR